MRKIIIYFICHLCYFSNAQTVEWVNTVGGKEFDFGKSIISDSLGNSYVLCNFSDRVDIDPGVDTLFVQISNYNYGLFIHKYDMNGNLMWMHYFQTCWDGHIKLDKFGNIIIVGKFARPTDFDPGPNEYILTNRNNNSLFLLHLDNDGNFLWAKNIMDGCVGCTANDIAIDKDGSILTTGSFQGNVDIDPSFNSYTLYSNNTLYDSDAFVLKNNINGDLLWGKTFKGVENQEGQSIITDSLGNIYVAGHFYKNTDFDPGPSNHILTTLNNYDDVFLVKLKSDGNFIWAKEYNHSATSYSIIRDIVIDNNHDLVIIGSFLFDVDFDFGPATHLETSKGNFDCYILKLDLNANIKWVKTYGTIDDELATKLTTDDNNNYLIGGIFNNKVYFGSNLPILESHGNTDIFILKTDVNGNEIWAKSFGGADRDFIGSIAITGSSVFFTGSYSVTGVFDCLQQISNGDSDFFAAKISECIPENSVDTIVACDSYKWIDGVTYTNSIDSIIYSPSNNICCDSTFTLNLTINKSSYDVLEITAQDSLVWNDSIYNTTGNYVEVYTNRNGCDSTVHLNLFIIQDEICNNGIDDDLDGYVDGFDNDCPCSDSLYNNLCKPNCQSSIIDTSFKLVKKWESEKIGSSLSNILTFDSSIFVRKIKGGRGIFLPDCKNSILTLSGLTGISISDFDFNLENSFSSSSSHFSIFKYKDTIYTVFNHKDTLILKNQENVIKWSTAGISNFRNETINISDINGDNLPEIIIANKIVSFLNGAILLQDTIVKGKNSFGTGIPPGSIPSNWDGGISNSVIADLLPTPGLEIAAGNTIYEVILNNNFSNIGNQLIPHTAESQVKDGLTSVGDIDGDGLLDVIVVRNQYYEDGGGIYVWNPRTGAMIARAPSGESGSVPFVGDIDGDCHPEIGVVFANQLRMYQYDGTTNLKIMYTIPTSDGSGNTGITMFDFNQDGNNELVYRDETTLRIFEGATGKVLVSTPMLSRTGMEHPIIADIDMDGQAEIITSGYLPGDNDEDSRIYCFKSGGAPWAPARSVWNQYGYHVTNVNDDLTIPRYQQNSAAFFDTDSCAQFTCPQPYNKFMVQATYRTQEGCMVWPASDVSLNVMRYECNADSLIFYLIVGNDSDKNITEDTMYLSIYATIPDMTASPLERRTIYLSRESDGKVSSSDTIRLAMVMPNTNIKTLLFRINDGGLGDAYSVIHGLSPTLECDYENNSALVAIDISARTLDLGPDILKCRTEVITLDAGSGFVSYLWNDLSEDALFSTSEAGVYSLTATDQCGRIYQDTVTLTIDESLKPNLGPDILLCEGDTTSISVGNEFAWVQWYPGEMVSCDTCFNTLVIADSTFDLVLISTKSGCIDADTIAIDVKDLPRCEKQTSICAGTSIDFYGVEIADAGRYEHRLGQCDSLIILDVTLLKIDSTLLSEEICIGDSIQIHNTWQYQSGTYTESFKNSNGCDSTSVVTLKVAPYLLENDSLSICEGDSIIVNGQMVYTAGLYVDTLSVDGSCQKIMTTQVSLINRVEERMLLTLCPDSSAMVGNLVIDESGTFTVSLKSQAGCDSTLTILANKLTWPQPPTITINCKDEQYTATWTAQAPWNIEWDDGSTDTIFRQEEGGRLTMRSYTDGCEKVFEYDLPQIPKLSDIPQLGDQLVKGSVSLPLSVDLDEASWTIEWSPEGLFSCATCFDTEVTTNTDATITVSMTHESGCSFEQQFRIIRDVKSDISIPNIFNPTSTGGNNLWTVTLPTGSLVAEVNIYDRWGNQVFTSKNENQMMWDGNYQGKELSSGVYVYHVKVIDGDGKISMLYGDVTLVR